MMEDWTNTGRTKSSPGWTRIGCERPVDSPTKKQWCGQGSHSKAVALGGIAQDEHIYSFTTRCCQSHRPVPSGRWKLKPEVSGGWKSLIKGS